MVDIRRDLEGLRKGLILCCLGLFINPVIHGVNVGEVLFAIGAALFAFNVTPKLMKYTKKFDKIKLLAGIICGIVLGTSIYFAIYNANPSDGMFIFEDETFNILTKEYYDVAYASIALQTIYYALVVVFYYFVITGLNELSVAFPNNETSFMIKKARKNFIFWGIFLVAMVFVNQIIQIFEMNDWNKLASAAITEDEYYALSIKYSFISIAYAVADIGFWILTLRTNKGLRYLQATAVKMDNGEHFTANKDVFDVDAKVTKEEKIDDYHRYDDEIK